MTNSQKWLTTSLILIFSVLIYLLSPVLTPFLIAAIISYLFNPVVDKLTSCHIPRTLSVTIAFIIILLILLSFIFLIVPIMEKQITVFVKRIPEINKWLANIAWPIINKHFHIKDQINLDHIKNILLEHIDTSGGILNKTWKMASHSGSALIAFLTNLMLIPVLIFYLLCDWNKLIKRIKELLPKRSEKKIMSLVRECGDVLAAFFRGQLLVMLCLGIIYGAGLFAIGLEIGLLIGIIAGLLSIVPYLGFTCGILLAIFASLIQFHNLLHLFLVLIVFGVGSITESFILIPWLVGDHVGLHPLAVIFAIMAFGKLFGFIGVLLAVPISAIIMVFLRQFHKDYLNSCYYNMVINNDKELKNDGSSSNNIKH